MNRLGYRIVCLVGMGLMAFGYGLFLGAQDRVGYLAVMVNSFLIGLGMGLVNLTALVAAQTGVPLHRIGVATSTIMLFRTFGGAFGVSLMGSVLFNQMHRGLSRLSSDSSWNLSSVLREKLADPQNLMDPSTRALIPQEILSKLVESLSHSLWYAFLTALILMLLGLGLSLWMAGCTPSNTPRSVS